MFHKLGKNHTDWMQGNSVDFRCMHTHVITEPFASVLLKKDLNRKGFLELPGTYVGLQLECLCQIEPALHQALLGTDYTYTHCSHSLTMQCSVLHFEGIYFSFTSSRLQHISSLTDHITEAGGWHFSSGFG
jgi:hypothetical protein